MRCSSRPSLWLSPYLPPAALPPEKQVKKQPSRQLQNLYLLPAILLLLLMSSTSGSKLAASNHQLEQQQQQQQLEHHHHHDHYQQQRKPLPESATSPLNSGSNGKRKRKTKVPPSPSITSKAEMLMINHVATTAKSLTTTTDNATSNLPIEWPHSSLDINEKKRLSISSQTYIKDRFHTNGTTAFSSSSSNNSASNHERSSSERRKRQPQDSDRLRVNSYINNNNNNNNAIGPETETLEMGAQLTSSSALTSTTATISHDSTSTAAAAATITTSEDTNSNSSEPLKCRVEKNFYLDFEQYKHYTCANCYNMIPKHLFVRKFVHRKERRIWLYDNDTNRQLLPNETETLKGTFKNEYNYQKWLNCCREAELCCLNNRKHLPKTRNPQTGQLIDEEPREKCHATWDGLACWPESLPGLVEQRCRGYVYFFDFEPVCEGYVKKQCFANGSWYIRNDHEWSDFSGCAALTIYATRLLIGSVWHLVSAIVIGPALIVFSKMPNRGGSKRVRILRNLLFWLLVNSLLSASHKIGVIGGFFIQETSPSPPSSTTTSTSTSSSSSLTSSQPTDSHLPATDNSSQSAATTTQLTTLKEVERNTRSIGSHIPLLDVWNERFDRVKLIYEQLDANLDTANDECHDYSNPHDDQQPDHWQLSAIKSKSKSLIPINDHLDQQQQRLETSTSNQRPPPQVAQVDPRFATTPELTTKGHTLSDNSDKPIARGASLVYKHPYPQYRLSDSLETDVDGSRTVGSYTLKTVSSRSARCKRSTSSNQSKYQKQPPFVIFICWIVSVGIRVTRLLHYAWMFTGAVYLCSILHFAPAEPPSLFIKYLMILTNGFPGVIGIIYIITRTIYEPSPLTLLVKLPFYHLIGDEANIKYLWETQLVCWMSESKHEFIEEIAEFPNLVLIILNAGLFIVTLIIMCRITRPGSTRPEMSLGDYFKAAGTLVLLYGAHYALIAYRPPIEGCIKAQVFYYLFLFVDGIQGIAVSWVFCYRTNEGREITNKWRAAWSRYALRRMGLTSAERSSTRQQSFLGANSKSNQSTRSNNSVCNGKDVATELINIADMQTSASQC